MPLLKHGHINRVNKFGGSTHNCFDPGGVTGRGNAGTLPCELTLANRDVVHPRSNHLCDPLHAKPCRSAYIAAFQACPQYHRVQVEINVHQQVFSQIDLEAWGDTSSTR